MAEWEEPKRDYTTGNVVTPQIFNRMAENAIYLKETKIESKDVQTAKVQIVEANERKNLNSLETISSAFGIVKKWISDIKGLAFKSRVRDDDIESVSASKVKGLHAVAISGEYSDLRNIPILSKSLVGLDQVENERQYSAVNPPPYPVLSVNGKSGEVNLDLSGDVLPTGSYPQMTVGNSSAVNSINISEEGGLLMADGLIVEKKQLLWQGFWDLNAGTDRIVIPNWEQSKPFEVWFETSVDFTMCSIQRFVGSEFEVFTEKGKAYIYTSGTTWIRGRRIPSDEHEGFAITRVYQITT